MTRPATTEAPARKLNLGRLERLQRLLQYGAALVLLVFVALIALAWTELRDLDARRDRAREALTKAERELAAVNGELALKQSALAASQKANTVLSGYAGAYADEHPDKAETVSRALREAVETSIAQADAGGGQQAAAQVPPRVYVQIVNAGQRARAGEVVRKLQAAGFLVPGVENVERRGIRQSGSDVRFYGDAQAAQPDVENIRAVLGGFGVNLKTVALAASGAVRPRHYELWLGDDFAAPEEAATRPGAGTLVGPLVTRPARPNADALPRPDRSPQQSNQKPRERNDPRRTSP
ncbi:MAG TPA: LytR C-terminal domain-containing protein [Pyrinomonadaceae bacterium]|jgi:hypothetical protein